MVRLRAVFTFEKPRDLEGWQQLMAAVATLVGSVPNVVFWFERDRDDAGDR